MLKAQTLPHHCQGSAIVVSNVADCRRYRCRPTPWNWASHWVLEQCDCEGHERVCDLGAGKNSIITQNLQARTRQLVLVDIARDPAWANGPDKSVRRIQADMAQLPFESDAFDHVISISVFEHLSTIARECAISEMQRILRPGGKAVVTVGHFLGADHEAERLLRTLPFFTDRQCGVFLPVDILSMLESAPQLAPCGRCSKGDSWLSECVAAANEGLVSEAYRDVLALTPYPALREVKVVEVGVVLVKCR